MQTSLEERRDGGVPAGVDALTKVVPPLVAGVVAAAVLLAGWRGADWPAQVFRIEMFRRDGFTVWNNHWYGGHHSVGYSLLMPALGATFGAGSVALVAAVVSTSALRSLLVRVRPDPVAAGIGASLFAVAWGANLAVGRLPFQLGVAIGLVALVAWDRGRLGWAVGAAVACGMASPVAALFLGVVAGGLALTRWTELRDVVHLGDVRGQGPLLAVAAMGPVIVLAIVFPSGGTFPFAWGGVVASFVCVAALVVLSGPEDRAVRGVLVVVAALVVAAFVLPTPVGGNAARLPMFFTVPVGVVLGWRHRRALTVVGVAAGMAWAWAPAEDAVLRAADDPTLDAAYFDPMIAAIRAEAGEPVRVEIPFTRRHWEAAHVAPELPLARGWERQLDRDVNPIFYQEGGPTAMDLYGWLRANAVRYVALPDAELDPSAAAEVALLEQGQPFLRPVWEDANWRVWEVINSDTLVSGAVELLDMTSDSIVLAVDEPGPVLVRVRYSPHWRVEGPACVSEDPVDGWTVVDAPEAGTIEVVMSPSPLSGVSGASADPCEDD